MRKRLLAILICAFFVVATAVPALACTPPLHPPKMPDLEKAYDAAYEAGKKAAENVVIPDSYFKTETESETEPETETETEAPSKDWSSYFPDSFTNMMNWFRKEVNSKWNRLSTMSNQN